MGGGVSWCWFFFGVGEGLDINPFSYRDDIQGRTYHENTTAENSDKYNLPMNHEPVRNAPPDSTASIWLTILLQRHLSLQQ